MPFSVSWQLTLTVGNAHDAFQWQLQTPVDVERFKEFVNLVKIFDAPIIVADGEDEIINARHHARLKEVFEELIVQIY
jgi:hypothetical protein